jgi:hypothetical protein
MYGKLIVKNGITICSEVYKVKPLIQSFQVQFDAELKLDQSLE